MPKFSDCKPVELSARVYRRLLAVYPAEYRQEYGEPMAQHFCDLCHDAWVKAGGWGLAVVWLRTAGDLVKTSVIEHLNTLRQRKSMQDKPMVTFRRGPTPRAAFLAIFAIAFCFAVGLAFLTPEQFCGIALVKAQNVSIGGAPASSPEHLLRNYDTYFLQAQFELLQSDRMLSQVVKKLRLAKTNTGRADSGGVSEAEAVKALKHRLELRPVRNTSLIEIRAYSATPNQAAQIANTLAESYQEFSREVANRHTAERASSWTMVEIVDTAVPGIRPVRPNKPFTLFLGIFGGAILAGTVARAITRFRRTPTPSLAAS